MLYPADDREDVFQSGVPDAGQDLVMAGATTRLVLHFPVMLYCHLSIR